jgi:phosphatidylserine decarboxylase
MPSVARGTGIFRAAATRPVPPCRPRCIKNVRTFTAARRIYSEQQQHKKDSFGARLRYALNNTRIQWYAIPAAAGIGFLGAFQFFKVTQRENALREEEERAAYNNGDDEDPKRPKKRKRIRPSGPWLVLIIWSIHLVKLTLAPGRFRLCQPCP